MVEDSAKLGEDSGEIEFDLDSVDLDTPEPVVIDGEPEAELADDGGTELEFEGLELEMESPEEPEEDLEK